MTPSKRFALSVTCAAVLSGSGVAPAQAQSGVPAAIPFQGFLSDAEGHPIDQPDPGVASETGTTELYAELQSVPVSAGRFVAFLGGQAALPLELFRDNPQIWVQIEIDGDDELPRFQIGAVPFAATAEYAHRTDWAGLTDVPNGLDDGDNVLERSTVENFARGVCFDTEAELTQALNDNYLRVGLTCRESQKVRGVDARGNLLCAEDADTNTLYTAAYGGGLALAANAFSIAAGGVVNANLAANSVDSSRIRNASVRTVDIANHAINTDKIAARAVTRAKIQGHAVNTVKLANGAVIAAKLDLDEGAATTSTPNLAVGTNWIFPTNAFSARTAACHVSVHARSPLQAGAAGWSLTVARQVGTGANATQEAAGPTLEAVETVGGTGMVARGSWRIQVHAGEVVTFGARVSGVPDHFVGPLDLSVTYLCI